MNVPARNAQRTYTLARLTLAIAIIYALACVMLGWLLVGFIAGLWVGTSAVWTYHAHRLRDMTRRNEATHRGPYLGIVTHTDGEPV